MTNDVIISFCLPCYNVKKYVRQCIESIVHQCIDEESYEILCYDDVSKDGTLEELKRLSYKYPITIYQGETNKGCSFARNTCLDFTNGKYIWFVDPDDMLTPYIVNTFIKIAEENQADFVAGNYRNIRESTTIEECKSLYQNKLNNFWKVEEGDIWLPTNETGTRLTSACCGLWRKKYLTGNNLKFREGIVFQEDKLLFWESEQKTPRIIKSDDICYLYRIRNSSITHNRNVDTLKKIYESTLKMLSIYESYCEKNKCKDIESLQSRIHHTKEDVAYCLAIISDTKYVKKEYAKLKKNKIYPYPFRKAILNSHCNIMQKYIYYFLPIPVVFWSFHFIYKNYSRTKWK